MNKLKSGDLIIVGGDIDAYTSVYKNKRFGRSFDGTRYVPKGYPVIFCCHVEITDSYNTSMFLIGGEIVYFSFIAEDEVISRFDDCL